MILRGRKRVPMEDSWDPTPIIFFIKNVVKGVSRVNNLAPDRKTGEQSSGTSSVLLYGRRVQLDRRRLRDGYVRVAPSGRLQTLHAEMKVASLEGAVCDKPRWWEKVPDLAITAQWKEG